GGLPREDVNPLFPCAVTAAPEGIANQSRAEGIDRRSTVYVVSCVGKKQDHACKAADLYVSEWFRKARTYVEATRCPWFILSAEYGFLEPGRVVAPYDKTLNR